MELDISGRFFMDEEREGFFVPEKMKRCWAAEIKILTEVARICKRHQLKWYAEYGTLLGAVRHKGFIPWDDDIDISMPREDYERLWQILPKELPPYYFPRSRYLDPEMEKAWGGVYNRRHADCGDSEEEAVITGLFYGTPYHHVIDVFPLDYVAADANERSEQKQIYYDLREILNHYEDLERDGSIFDKLLNLEKRTGVTLTRDRDAIKPGLWELEQKIAKRYSREESGGMTNLYFWTCGEDDVRPFAAYEETVWLPFEMIEVPAPAGYEDVLEGIFGDWRTPRNIGADHEYPYFKKEEEMIRKIRLGRLIEKAESLNNTGRQKEAMQLIEKGMREISDSYELNYLYAQMILGDNMIAAKQYLEKALRLCDNAEHHAAIEEELKQFQTVEV